MMAASKYLVRRVLRAMLVPLSQSSMEVTSASSMGRDRLQRLSAGLNVSEISLGRQGSPTATWIACLRGGFTNDKIDGIDMPVSLH